jgi:hypothetical protein
VGAPGQVQGRVHPRPPHHHLRKPHPVDATEGGGSISKVQREVEATEGGEHF